MEFIHVEAKATQGIGAETGVVHITRNFSTNSYPDTEDTTHYILTSCTYLDLDCSATDGSTLSHSTTSQHVASDIP